MSQTASLLEDYAQAMFRHERLHDRWVGTCARWLRELFQDSLEGRTVIDYAFGRGNWSLAFLRAGADRVIAVDAAASNCERLSAFLVDQDLGGVEVVCGNVLDGPIDASGDLVWLHGVLHHVAEVDPFLDGIRTLASGPEARFHVYHYDAGSLREFVVETARTFTHCEGESEFTAIDGAFTRVARQRAADDLVAPHIAWRSAAETNALLRRHGLYPVRQDASFTSFRRGWESEEFQPHHLLCAQDDTHAIRVREPARPWAAEIGELERLSRALAQAHLNPDRRRLLGVGIMNTHFGAIESEIFAGRAIDEVFLFLVGHLARVDVEGLRRDDDARVDAWIELARASAAGHGAGARPDLPDLRFSRWLRETAVRL